MEIVTIKIEAEQFIKLCWENMWIRANDRIHEFCNVFKTLTGMLNHMQNIYFFGI